jgi:hypothetical protein
MRDFDVAKARDWKVDPYRIRALREVAGARVEKAKKRMGVRIFAATMPKAKAATVTMLSIGVLPEF